MADTAGQPLEILEIWPSETGITDIDRGQLPRISLTSMRSLQAQWLKRRNEIGNEEAIAVFSDQLANEWAIETGQIENLYTIERGITLALIEKGFSAAVLERGSTNKPPEEVLALITDQRDALQGLFDFVKKEQPLSIGYIKALHAALTRSQTTTEAIDQHGNRVEVKLVRGDWKKLPNFPMRDGKMFKYCPVEQTQSEMERLVSLHLAQDNEGVPPETQAAWLHHRFTQIHPFQDGNGRVARALASLVLIRGGMFPMVVRLEDKNGYLDALEAADSGDLRPLVLTIARGQQGAFRNASDLITKLSPDAQTVEEAAESLRESLQHSHHARMSRAQVRIERARDIASVRMDQALQKTLNGIKASTPSAQKVSHHQTPPKENDLQKLAPKDLDGPLTTPVVTLKMGLNVPKDWALEFFFAPLLDDIEERIVAFLRLEIAGRIVEFDCEPLYIGDGDIREVEASIAKWTDNAVIGVLNGFAKGRFESPT